jgi:hypothetical protein
MNLTTAERERLYYMQNHPDHHLLAKMVDLEHENNEQYWEIDSLQKRLSIYTDDDWK